MSPCIESSRPSPRRSGRRTKQHSSLNAMLAADSGQDLGVEEEVFTSTVVSKPKQTHPIVQNKESVLKVVRHKEEQEQELKPEDTRALARNLRRAKRALLLKSVEDQDPPACSSLLHTRLLSMSLKQRNESTDNSEHSLSSHANTQAVCIFRAPSRNSSEERMYYTVD